MQKAAGTTAPAGGQSEGRIHAARSFFRFGIDKGAAPLFAASPFIGQNIRRLPAQSRTGNLKNNKNVGAGRARPAARFKN